MPRKNPRRNISRIEQFSSSGSDHHGWEVRIQRKGERVHKYFADRQHGGSRVALQAAKNFRDNMESKMISYTPLEMANQRTSRNRSGVVGVRRVIQVETRGDYEFSYPFWVAQWTDRKGRRKTRSFSIAKYGEDDAFDLAVEARYKGLS